MEWFLCVYTCTAGSRQRKEGTERRKKRWAVSGVFFSSLSLFYFRYSSRSHLLSIFSHSLLLQLDPIGFFVFAVVWIKNSVYMYKKVRALVRFLLAWHSERFCGVGGVKKKNNRSSKKEREEICTHKKVLKYYHWKTLVPYTDIHKRKREKYSERKDCARWLKSESLGKYFAI